MPTKIIKSKIFIILYILFFSLFSTHTYAGMVPQLGLDATMVHSYLGEDESGDAEIQNVVNNFLATFIRPEMSDLEKEIAIIKYLVENVDYDFDEYNKTIHRLNNSYKAYGALVNKKAVCSGYAKAFDLLAKKCGLTTNIITGDAYSGTIYGPHAWNQIFLDGEWYNVDVTFEDPISNVKLGYENLLNKYINLPDTEMSLTHDRDNGHICTATKYGRKTIAYYLYTGIVDPNGNVDDIRRFYDNMMSMYIASGDVNSANAVFDKYMFLGAKLDDDSNFIAFPTNEIVNNYILNKYNAGIRTITFVTVAGTKNNLEIDTDKFLSNYIHSEKAITLHKFFSTNGVYDTRVLIFS